MKRGMWLVAGAFVGMACSGEVSSFDPNHDALDTGDTGERVDYEIGPCSSLMIQVETDTLALGEWDEDWIEPYSENVIAKFDLTVKGFCMDQFPFPGMEGADWPTDGLNGQQIATLHEALAAFGRRTCDTEELMLAASGTDNQRFPTDTEQMSESDCDPDDFNPSPLGTYEACESPLGFRDFQVRSTWSVLDDDVADQLEATLPGYALPVGEGGFGVWGGTSRTDTFYAPTNFGIHFHDEADDSYMDDGFRVCADVDTVTGLMEEDYQDWLWTFMQDGSYAALLGG